MIGPELKSHKILKHVSTRWLSLIDSINRVLEQWEPLKLLFHVGEEVESQEACNSKFLAVKTAMETYATKLYLLFLKNTLPIFIKYNIMLQVEAPSIHKVARYMYGLLMDIMVRFVKAETIGKQSEESLNCISNIKFTSRSCQKDDNDLVIGVSTRQYIKQESEAGRLSGDDIKQFYKLIRNFFATACKYILEKFPFHDSVVKHAEVADISLRASTSFSSVLFFIELFPNIINNSDKDNLEVEFASYQADKLNEEILNCERMDVAWAKIANLKDASGNIKYSVLPPVMLAILVIPHSNAATERIFSVVRKNQTDFRPNMNTKTLGALLVEKTKMFSCSETCYQKQFTEKDLREAKEATGKMLQEK